MRATAAAERPVLEMVDHPMTDEIDLERAKTDFPYFCEKVLATPATPFQFNEAQRRLWAAMEKKARKTKTPRP
jgi:hypothetical protein